jgi:hypothetical protein
VVEAETCCHLVTLNKINIHNTSCVLTCESSLLTCKLHQCLFNSQSRTTNHLQRFPGNKFRQWNPAVFSHHTTSGQLETLCTIWTKISPYPLTFWHRSFRVNSNKSPTWCNDFSVYYPDVCLQLNMFRAFSRPSSGAQWLQWQPLVLSSYRGDSRAVFVVGPAGRPDHEQQHGYHHDTKVNTEAATAVSELLMMGGKTPEKCWAVNKRQDNKLKNFCIMLVIYLN